MGVIVGVDHREGAKAALRFALEEAKLHRARLRAVYARRFPDIGYTGAVIGAGGPGGFRGLLLGSVGRQVAHHGACPVVIVPHGRCRPGQ